MSEPLYCVNHPNVETYLRCNKCGRPICAKCAVLTPVGYRCPDCIRAQQKVFYADFRTTHYLIALAVALTLSTLAGSLIHFLGWYALVLGPLIGSGIAAVTRWAVRYRRGEYLWLVVCGSIIVGLLPAASIDLVKWVTVMATWHISINNVLFRLLWDAVYAVLAVGAAYYRLRPGRRV